MLENEGFTFDRYVDIFDGGPTVIAPTDQIRTVREAREAQIGEIGEEGPIKCILATGRLRTFRAGMARYRWLDDGQIGIGEDTAGVMDLGIGDHVLVATR
jgi:arginine N-succinyltransferase